MKFAKKSTTLLLSLCLLAFQAQAESDTTLLLQRFDNVRFGSEKCSEQSRQCRADLKDIYGNTVKQNVVTPIILLNIVNGLRSTGSTGTVYVAGTQVLAASRTEYLNKIDLEQGPALFNVKQVVLGLPESHNTLLKEELRQDPGYWVYSILYSHQGDGQKHQVCDDETGECREYVDNSYNEEFVFKMSDELARFVQSNPGATLYVGLNNSITAAVSSNGIMALSQ